MKRELAEAVNRCKLTVEVVGGSPEECTPEHSSRLLEAERACN